MSADDLPAVRPAARPAHSLGEDLQEFEKLLLDHLEGVGLPSDGVLVGVDQRRRLIANVDGALEPLNGAQRLRSIYISKMLAAAAAGLFDAALAYLWDETVSELRRRVSGYDLAYFFDLAARSSEQRRRLNSEEDLPKVDDADLMRAARGIGLISDVGYAQLDHIRYMRNYASAAHPNQVNLTGLQLAQYLETCIREVITLPLDTVVAEIRTLLRNVKTDRLTDVQCKATASFFDRLPPEQADNLAAGLFGVYTDPGSAPATLDNVRALWPDLWPYVGEDARSRLGTKYGRFESNADQQQAARARELLDLVEADAYLPEPVRTAEIDRALEALLTAHHGWNNFHTEPPLARALAALVGAQSGVPDGLRSRYVHVLVEVFLTNGLGESWGADPIYRELIARFDVEQAALALRTFTDSTIASRLQFDPARRKWTQLLDVIEPKLTRRADRDLLAAVRAFTGAPDQLRSDTAIRRLLDPSSGRRAADRSAAPAR